MSRKFYNQNVTNHVSKAIFKKIALFRLLPMAKRCAEHNVEMSREFEVVS